jgi:alcohol dehydrogenase YqhD (iron-dependent ADH family)
MDDKEERNKLIFCRIFNLTFVECLEHFRGSKKIEVLEGINNLEDYIKMIGILMRIKNIAISLNISLIIWKKLSWKKSQELKSKNECISEYCLNI